MRWDIYLIWISQNNNNPWLVYRWLSYFPTDIEKHRVSLWQRVSLLSNKQARRKRRRNGDEEKENRRGRKREREKVNEESCELIVSARFIHEASTYSFRVVLSYNNSQNHVSRVSELARPRAQTSSVPACNC